MEGVFYRRWVFPAWFRVQGVNLVALETDILFRGMDRSLAVEETVEKYIEKIERHFPDVRRCAVVVEQATKSHAQGNLFSVNLELVAPGKDVHVTRDAGRDHSHEDVYVAIRDSFDAAERQLKKLKRDPGYNRD